MADPRLTYPLHLPALNKAIASRVREIRGDGIVNANRTDDAVALTLDITALLTRLPLLVGIFKLAASATKPGMYTANPLKLATAQPSHSASSQLADTDFGVVDSSNTVYLINVREVAVAGHALSTSNKPDVFIGFFRGIEADGKPIYAIDECQ